MNVYILPNVSNVNIKFNFVKSSKFACYISNSIFFHIQEMKRQFEGLDDNKMIKKIAEPYNFVYSDVIGTNNQRVTKDNLRRNICYELIELLKSFSLSYLLNISKYEILKNVSISVYSEENYDVIYESFFESQKEIEMIVEESEYKKNDIMFFEFSEKSLLRDYTFSISWILMKQKKGGCLIIKMHGIYEKYIVEYLFMLSSWYEKVYIFKPLVCEICSECKYVICLNFQCENEYESLGLFLENESELPQIIENGIPLFFQNRLEEINAILGYQQLEVYDQMINLSNNKNKIEKMETITRHHIQKCVQWCEKHNIECNKFSEKTNVFLMYKS
jgi:hypothetical protein